MTTALVTERPTTLAESTLRPLPQACRLCGAEQLPAPAAICVARELSQRKPPISSRVGPKASSRFQIGLRACSRGSAVITTPLASSRPLTMVASTSECAVKITTRSATSADHCSARTRRLLARGAI